MRATKQATKQATKLTLRAAHALEKRPFPNPISPTNPVGVAG
jgi:hypothetical protein